MALAAVAFAAWQTYRRSEETYVPGDRWRLIVLSYLVQAPRSQPEEGTGSTLQQPQSGSNLNFAEIVGENRNEKEQLIFHGPLAS